jgi:hypothetical protein
VSEAAGLYAAHLDGRPIRFNRRPPKVSDFCVCRAELAPAVRRALVAVMS